MQINKHISKENFGPLRQALILSFTVPNKTHTHTHTRT